MLSVLVGGKGRKAESTAEPTEVTQALDELPREGARRMIAQALELEVAEYLARHGKRSTRRATRWWCATASFSIICFDWTSSLVAWFELGSKLARTSSPSLS